MLEDICHADFLTIYTRVTYARVGLEYAWLSRNILQGAMERGIMGAKMNVGWLVVQCDIVNKS